MANNTVSVYIDDTSIRLMVTRGKRITKLADVPLESSLGDIDTAEKENELTNKVKALFKSNKIGEKKIILGLSGLHCLTRPISLPELPRAMVHEAVMREAKRVLPVPLEQLYISWQIVAALEGKLRVFMVAIPRQIADMVIKVFSQAGCKPYLMDIKPLALARLSREPIAVIVDVQSKEFDIVIMVNKIPQPIRTVAFPQESLSLLEKLSIVKEEVKRTVQFYNSNNADNPIPPQAPMLASGELADEPELYQSMASELGFTASLLTSPLKCIKQLDSSHHLVNVGLALKVSIKGAGQLSPNFNALPEPYLPKQISINRIMAVPAAVIAIGIVVLLVMTVQNASADIASIESQLESKNAELLQRQTQKKILSQQIEQTEQELAGCQASIASYNKALKNIDVIGDKMNNDLTVTVDSDYAVSDLYLAAVGISGTGISIDGAAATEQEVFEYVRKLDATGRFSEITILTIQLCEDPEIGPYVTYSLSCSLKENRE